MTDQTKALLPVTPEDNAVTVALTEWLINRDVFFEDGPPALERTMHDFGAFADDLIVRHRISHSLPGDVGTLALVAAPSALGSDGPAIAAQLREISRISNKYDLRECIEGHDDALGDSYIWRDLMDHCEKLGSKGSALSGDTGEVELRKELELSLSILDNVGGFLDDFAQADLDEGAADGVTVGMVYQQQAKMVVLPRITNRLTALRAALATGAE